MLKQKYCCKMPFSKEAVMIPFNQLSSANWAATYILFLIFAFIVRNEISGIKKSKFLQEYRIYGTKISRPDDFLMTSL